MNKRSLSAQRLLGSLLMSSLLWVQTVPVSAAQATATTPLASALQQFFQRQYNGSDMQVSTEVTTPAERQPSCLSPNFSLMPNGRPWGTLSVAVNCNGQKSYIQARVQVSGTYWVASRPINSGGHIATTDIERRHGRLDLLPPRAILDEKQAINAVTLRNINIGQPLTLSMLRRPWMVHAGQEVQVSASGGGFSVSSTGKAMNNAAANDSVRVRMPSGQIVNGTVAQDGSVSLMI